MSLNDRSSDTEEHTSYLYISRSRGSGALRHLFTTCDKNKKTKEHFGQGFLAQAFLLYLDNHYGVLALVLDRKPHCARVGIGCTAAMLQSAGGNPLSHGKGR